jgi:primosomal protein N' (replication factor Y) (superfamily II helicase)
MPDGSILRVAINAPLSQLFDYRAPADAAPQGLQPGCRVSVPFGRRRECGMIMEVANTSDLPASKLKCAHAALDQAPLLDEPDLWLVRFASDYYQHPLGETVAAALPALLRQGKSLYPNVQHVTLTAEGKKALSGNQSTKAPRQTELLERLRDAKSLTAPDLDAQMPGWKRLQANLLGKGWIHIEDVADASGGPARRPATPQAGPSLNADQARAVQAVRDVIGFSVNLLDGVTGSGKTEVYLRLIDETLRQNRQVLVLVPEIGLTPQLVARLELRLGIEPLLMHSSLSDNVRLAAWRAARDGSASLILGTRSAVFVPLRRPGLIIVDEEHDSSFKQQEGLRYSARDLAVARGKKLDIPVLLGSATPSLESLQRCQEGNYRRLVLPVRAGKAVPPLMRLVDLALHPASDGLSAPVVAAMTRNLAAGGQVLVFLNRRGFAPTLICQGCGAIAECQRCDARMTVHAGSNRLQCHHCGAVRPLDPRCTECGGTVTPLGHGTERLEEALNAQFREHTITRIDSDSTRLRGSMDKVLAMATAGASQILVGTQMLSKGHHFPNLTLVVVVNADQGLFSTDFRGTERLAQSLIQVAGRAGREQRQGEVIIQTAFASHPFWAELLRGGYERVATSALQERELSAWPPFSRLALLRAAATARHDAHLFLDTARRIAVAASTDDLRVLGPVSAPMERKAGRYRAQLLFQSRDRQALHHILQMVRAKLERDSLARRIRWSVDVDPVELF